MTTSSGGGPTDDERLSELLKSVVPPAPEPVGLAARVRRRAGTSNGRRTTLTIATVAAVTAAVVVLPRVVGGTPDQPTRSAAGLTPPSSPVVSPGPGLRPGSSQRYVPGGPGELTCASAGHRLAHADRIADGIIPLGAIAARLCGGSGGVAWQAPQDLLTAHVDALVAAYNHAPEAQALPCPQRPDSIHYTISFAYRNGRLIRATGSNDLCAGGVGLVGTPGLGKSVDLMRQYLADLQRQRLSMNAPHGVRPAPHCPASPAGPALGAGFIPTGKQLQLVAARVCHYPGVVSNRRAFVELTREQVADVDRDYALRATADRSVRRCDSSPHDPVGIIGVSAWGDRVWMRLGCNVFVRQLFDSTLYWMPSTSILPILTSGGLR